jgi:penicillin-binding protein 1A
MEPSESVSFIAHLRRHLPKSPWALLTFLGLGGVAAAVLVAALVALVLTPTLPSIDDLHDTKLKVPLRVYSFEGDLLAEYGEEKRIPVKAHELPPLLVQAILAAEDDGFYSHAGVDFTGILRAAINNLRAGRKAEGASTITMQVARNYFLTPERTYTRKLKEVLLAFKLERELSKNEILELYVNKIFLGNRAYGFAAAGQIYFGHTLNQLTLAEMATLAGLPKAPSRNNPLSNPESSLDRRNYILRRMLKLGYIDAVSYSEAIQAPLGASRHAVRYIADAPYIGEMVRQVMVDRFTEASYAEGYHVYTTIRSRLQKAAQESLQKGLLEYDRRHGWRGAAGHHRITDSVSTARLDDILKDYPVVGPLAPAVVLAVEEKRATLYTQDGTRATLEWEGMEWARRYIDEDTQGAAPKRAGDVVRMGDVVYFEVLPENALRLAQVPRVEGALVALNPNDGAITALAGGFDFYNSKFNRAVQAERQPGSGLKPFVYSAAFEKGFNGATLVSGAPIVVEDVSLEDEWRPEDYSREFFGPTRLRKALTLSLNLVSVRLLRAIGPKHAIDHLERFGFERDKLPRNLSLALGTASAKPVDMARAFAVFANGGYRVEPYFITRIEDSQHRVIEQTGPVLLCHDPADTVAVKNREAVGSPPCPPPATAPEKPDPANPAPRLVRRVLSAENAFIVNSILRDVVTGGTATGAMALGRKDLAGKTGTTNDHRDAWFNGFQRDHVAIAWVGFDQPTPLGRGEVGGRAALPVWIDYMRVALEDVPEKLLPVPPGVTPQLVNLDTGEPTTKEDPKAITEYFIDGAPAIGADTAAGTRDGGDGKQPAGQPSPGGTPPQPVPDNVRDKLF